VDWVVADGLAVEGDARLLRVVLENLFRQRLKFTAKRPRARIEFGALPQSNGVRTYFVRDDGAGFDMARADHLFAPFKRLHDQSQFRARASVWQPSSEWIAASGRIWAEGVVQSGCNLLLHLGG